MEEFKKFQSSTFDTSARRRSVEDQDTFLELTGKIQELQNEINCMNDFSTQWTFPRCLSTCVFFPPHPVLGGMLSRSIGMPSRREGSPSDWDTHGISGNVFAHPVASSSAPDPQELNPWSSHMWEPIHSSTVEKSERRTQDQDQRCQSGQSKNYGSDQQRLQISDLHFDKFPASATFACWKMRFKTVACTCSQFPTWATHWIKEVEMVDSVDVSMSSSSTSGIQMPNFEVFDARIASALNKIIHNSNFKWRISLEEQNGTEEDIRNKNMGTRNGNFEKNAVVKNQGTKQRVQRILGDCWQWETNGQCVKGDNCSFRHDVTMRGKMTQLNPSLNFFMQQNGRNSSRTRSPRGKSPSAGKFRWPCRDYLKETCTKSFCEKWHLPECLFYKSEMDANLREKCSYAHRQVDEQPSKRFKKNDDRSAVAMLKYNDLHDSVWRLVVNRDKSRERPGRPDKNRDHEL